LDVQGAVDFVELSGKEWVLARRRIQVRPRLI
jgi:hypothetical protein